MGVKINSNISSFFVRSEESCIPIISVAAHTVTTIIMNAIKKFSSFQLKSAEKHGRRNNYKWININFCCWPAVTAVGGLQKIEMFCCDDMIPNWQ